MSDLIKSANIKGIKNLFWLIPLSVLNTLLIIFGVWYGIYQRDKAFDKQIEMSKKDSLRGLTQDSSLVNVQRLERTLNLIK